MTLKEPIYMQVATGDTAVEYSAEDYRSLLHGLFRTDGIFRPDTAAGGLQVSQRGAGADLSVDVAAGRCIIEGDDASDQGKYFCWSTDVTNVTVPSPPASGTRTHLIIARVRDKLHQPSWSTYDWTIELVEDTGGGLPAVPASAIPLASVAVSSTDTSVQNSQIADLRYNTRLIGSQPTQVASDALRPPVPYPSELVWRTDKGCYEVWDGSAWRELTPRGGGGTAWTSYTPTLTATTTNPTLGTGSVRTGSYTQEGKKVTYRGTVKFGTSGVAAGSGFYEVSLPVAAVSLSNSRQQGTVTAWDNSAGNFEDGAIFVETGATTKARLSVGGLVATNSAPWTWAASDQFDFTIVYEAA